MSTGRGPDVFLTPGPSPRRFLTRLLRLLIPCLRTSWSRVTRHSPCPHPAPLSWTPAGLHLTRTAPCSGRRGVGRATWRIP